MNKRLPPQLGEIDVGKYKTSINIDEDVWKEFSMIVLEKKGNHKLSGVIEKLIKDYIKNNGGL